jgi:CBS domain-containing protein
MVTVFKGLLEKLERTNDFAEIRQLHEGLPRMFSGDWFAENIQNGVRLITASHDAIVRKVLSEVQRGMERMGEFPPDVPFCWVVMGSGGRCEQTFFSDQDYGLVYAETSPTEREKIEHFFSVFAERAVRALEVAGYPFCEGFVMPVNPRWRGDFPLWMNRLDGYLAFPHWEHARYLLIASDLRPVYGNLNLGNMLRSWLIERLRLAKFVQWQAAFHEREHGVALRPFSRLRTDRSGPRKGRFNLKEGLYLPLVNGLRIWAIREGFAGTETFERLHMLRQRGVWTREWGEQVEEALSLAFWLRLNEPMKKRLRGETPDPYIDPQELDPSEKHRLLQALKTAKRLQKLTAKTFRKPEGTE